MFDVNEYFEGRVKSISFKTASLPASMGVMASGEYEFSTSEFETMTVVSGVMNVLLPNADEWQSFEAGQAFTVEAKQRFKAKVKEDTAYLCTYG